MNQSINPAQPLPVLNYSGEDRKKELHGETNLGGQREVQEVREVPEERGLGHVRGTRKGVAGEGLNSRQDKGGACFG